MGKKAIIKEKVRDDLYRLTWGDEGGLNGEEPGFLGWIFFPYGRMTPSLSIASTSALISLCNAADTLLGLALIGPGLPSNSMLCFVVDWPGFSKPKTKQSL